MKVDIGGRIEQKEKRERKFMDVVNSMVIWREEGGVLRWKGALRG